MPTGFKRIGTVSAKVTRRGLLRPVDQDDERTPTMAEVKRYTLCLKSAWGGAMADTRESEYGEFVRHLDYARLERERDELKRLGRAVCALMGGIEGTPERVALAALAEACGRKG